MMIWKDTIVHVCFTCMYARACVCVCVCVCACVCIGGAFPFFEESLLLLLFCSHHQHGLHNRVDTTYCFNLRNGDSSDPLSLSLSLVHFLILFTRWSLSIETQDPYHTQIRCGSHKQRKNAFRASLSSWSTTTTAAAS